MGDTFKNCISKKVYILKILNQRAIFYIKGYWKNMYKNISQPNLFCKKSTREGYIQKFYMLEKCQSDITFKKPHIF